MSAIDHTPIAPKAAYGQPQIRDYGSLMTLTADFDLHFVGSMAKVMSLAAISAPLTGGGPDTVTSSNPVPDGGGVLGDTLQGGSGDGEVPALPTPDDGAGALGDRESGGTGGGSAGSGSGGGTGSVAAGGGAGGGNTGGGDVGGRLPFTGYAAMAVAGIGAALTGVGVAVRAKLRRPS